MKKIISALVYVFILSGIGGIYPVQAQVIADSRMSGAWYDPSHNGEGFLLEMLEDERAVVYWFTYDETGAQRWFTAVGEVSNNAVTFEELMVATGPKFGEGFNPDDIEYTDAGELNVSWSDCFNATVGYTVNGVAGSQKLERLSSLAGLECEAPVSDASSMSGSWFDRSHDGEGLVIQALDNGEVVIFWFSFDDEGEQAWFYGSASPGLDDIIQTELLMTRGGRFGTNFDPEEVEYDSWGTLVVELGCDYGKFDYASDLSVYGEGKQTLTRLTRLGEPVCDEKSSPNILLVIADDLGLDASNQYDISAERPVTPVLDRLADQGLVFENAWSNPTCSPTRAGILTGKFGSRTGVLTASDVLSTDETSLQSYMHELLPGKYVDAVIGKWHLGPQPGGLNHPADLGVSHFAGIIGGGVDDYEDWTLVENGQRSSETSYVTSKLVDLAVDWVNQQQDPWFMWLAFNAPHTPFHLPPSNLHNRNLSGSDADIESDPLPYYFAAIEAMDAEIGRFLDSMDEQTRANTVVIFVGDNGTPAQVAQEPYSRPRSKGSLYQGGINVPLWISGPGVTRTGERETALITTTDLFSTIAALAGVNVDQVNDSISFKDLLSEARASERWYQFSERSTDTGEEWAVSDGWYKLIASSDGEQSLYDLLTDPYENNDMVEAGSAPTQVVEDFQYLAAQIREPVSEASYAVVDTNQKQCFDTSGNIECPGSTEAFYGQDAQYAGHSPDYTDNGDGTISDNITRLMWQQSPDTNADGRIDADDKLSFSAAQSYCDILDLAGYKDWRLPDIKQLYSLIDFSGTDPSGYEGNDTSGLRPFIDTNYFDFGYGDTSAGERIIDAQYASRTPYVANTGNDGGQTLFGVNFADGRIKGYGLTLFGQDKTFYVSCVRSNEDYGQNDFFTNGDGTISDLATGLMWTESDSGAGLGWGQALAWVAQQNAANYLGYDDWRLPDAKELQSLVDYSRSPSTSDSAAIDPLFDVTVIVNEAGNDDYPSYWTGTTHMTWTNNPGAYAVYIAFGRAMGYMNNNWIDVHGAGAQRSDPKTGDPADYPTGHGPHGDAIRIYNHVRLVRDG
jgi:arylsulfatase A-like enzyme